MFGDVNALVGLHVTEKERDKRMQHTCSRHAAWVPHKTIAARISLNASVQKRQCQNEGGKLKGVHVYPDGRDSMDR